MKVFVDNVAAQAVETCLLARLNEILSPTSISEMDEGLVTAVAGEPEESQVEREQLSRKLAVLKSGLEICKRYASRPSRKAAHKAASSTEIEEGEQLVTPKPNPEPKIDEPRPSAPAGSTNSFFAGQSPKFPPSPSPTPSPGAGLFQGDSQPSAAKQPGTSGPFRSAPPAEQPASFGSVPTAANPPSSGLFGSAQPAGRPASSWSFVQPAPATTSAGFGGSGNAATTGNPSPFGSFRQPSGFGQPAATGAATNGFGSSAFGGANQGSLFGSKSNQDRK